jgi:hypothetical protein
MGDYVSPSQLLFVFLKFSITLDTVTVYFGITTMHLVVYMRREETNTRLRQVIQDTGMIDW